jgi:ABC-type phosphate transport system substrate-binding protein
MRSVMMVLLSAVVLSMLTFRVSPSLAASEEALLVIVHPKSPVDRVSSYEIEALFTRAQTRWSDGSTVYPFSFVAGSAARDTFDRVVLRLSLDQVGRFWVDRRIRGLGMPPKQVPSAALMAQIVSNLPGAIGYLPSSRARAGLKVVARIAQGKVLSP